MTEETINVKLDVNQLQEGRAYKGNISFDEHIFNYELQFKIPLCMYEPKDDESLMDNICLSVTDAKGEVVLLDDTSKALFMGTAGRFVFEFYCNPQTIGLNSGVFGRNDPAGCQPLGIHGTGTGKMVWGYSDFSISIGMSREYELHRTPELDKFLESYRQ